MSALETNLGNYFKSEIKAAGRKFFTEDKVSISGASDSTIKAHVRGTPPVSVLLMSDGIASRSVTAGCSCPAGKKSQFCKHVWAALEAADEKYPDFLSEKTSIEKNENQASAAPSDKASYAETAKRRASEYRKDQYQKQKARLKDQKRGREARETATVSAYPEEVAISLAYFEQNGFPMPAGPDASMLAEAKRKLSRVFHPDKGGSHEETVELNHHCEIVFGFLRN